MSKGIVTEYPEICIFCGRQAEAEHHLIFGTAGRELSEKDNEYMFQVVECNTYMKRIKDGKYIRHSEQYSDVYYYVDENAEEKERKVEPEEWGGSDFVKRYYEAVEKRFVGVVIGMKLITLKAELFCDSACRPDGVEVDFVNRNDIEQKKVAIVAYGCNKTRLVPLEALEEKG